MGHPPKTTWYYNNSVMYPVVRYDRNGKPGDHGIGDWYYLYVQ
jgi:hypothetical protein